MFQKPKRKGWIVKLTQWLNEGYFFKYRAKITSFDWPENQKNKLKACIKENRAVFLTPSHPEFMTDWAVDKWVIDHYAPKALSWAAPFILKGPIWIQKFWSYNGLIAAVKNKSGEINPAVQFSVDAALSGTPILLHPEGAVNWNPQEIGSLRLGAAQMALECWKKNPTETWIVPWSTLYRFQDTEELYHAYEQWNRDLKSWIGADHDIQESAVDSMKKIMNATVEKMERRWMMKTQDYGWPKWKDFAKMGWSEGIEQWSLSLIEYALHEKLDPNEWHFEWNEEVRKNWRKWIYSSKVKDYFEASALPLVHEMVELLMGLDRIHYPQVMRQDEITLDTWISIYQRFRADHRQESISDRIHAFIPKAMAKRVCLFEMEDPWNIGSWLIEKNLIQESDEVKIEAITFELHQKLTACLIRAQERSKEQKSPEMMIKNPWK